MSFQISTPIHVGPYTFEHAAYYADADLLVLGRRPGQGGIGGGDTPEGHAWLYPNDFSQEVIGAELHHVRAQLEQKSAVTITLSDGEPVRVPDVERLLTTATR